MFYLEYSFVRIVLTHNTMKIGNSKEKNMMLEVHFIAMQKRRCSNNVGVHAADSAHFSIANHLTLAKKIHIL